MSPRQHNLIIIWYCVLFALTVGVLIVAFTGGVREESIDSAMLGAGLLGLIVLGSLLPVVSLLVRVLRARSNDAGQMAYGDGDESTFWQQRMEHALVEIRDLATLTDDAKRVLFKNRERIILNALVDQAIAARHFEGAESLCRVMQTSLGHGELAASCRGRIERARAQAVHDQTEAALVEFEACLNRRDWGGAYQEAARIRRLYPDLSMSAHLDERVESARDEHKLELEHAFRDASARDDVSHAMSVLKELDRYLTREEGERLRDDAADIIQRYRERLGTSFQIALQEKRWSDAAQFGTTIMEEYPNSKMAGEVRSMIEVLRTRATQAAVGQYS
ncbi:MAG: hypothetical protein ACR2GY_07815 [Phycisphaerales bacterium]